MSADRNMNGLVSSREKEESSCESSNKEPNDYTIGNASYHRKWEINIYYLIKYIHDY